MAPRQDKREDIREAAIRVIAAHGYHYATTDKIAEAAGIAVGTIYNYFRNKEEILEYIFQVEVEKRFRYYDALSVKDIPALDKLRQLLTMHFAEIMVEPAVGQVMVRERYSPADQQLPGIKEFILGVPMRLEKLLDEAVSNGEIRPCDTAIVAIALWGSVEAIASKAVFEADSKRQRWLLSQAPSELLSLYCEGMKATK
ncbi:MAG: TetR/AcrR family transcriptional regulator [Firmicutes bacterium]|nr:TetR/AcrR family transcriptional regulator [Bacillota bacterium]